MPVQSKIPYLEIVGRWFLKGLRKIESQNKQVCFVLTLNRFFILLQRGLYSNRKFSSYLDPDKAEARFRVKIKHPHGGEKTSTSLFPITTVKIVKKA